MLTGRTNIFIVITYLFIQVIHHSHGVQKSTVCSGQPSQKQTELCFDSPAVYSIFYHAVVPRQPLKEESSVFQKQMRLPEDEADIWGWVGYFGQVLEQPVSEVCSPSPKMLSQVMYFPGSSPQSSAMRLGMGRSRMYFLPATSRQKQLAGAFTNTVKAFCCNPTAICSNTFLASSLFPSSGKYFQSMMTFLVGNLPKVLAICSITFGVCCVNFQKSCASPNNLTQVSLRWQLPLNPQICPLDSAYSASTTPKGCRYVPQTTALPHPKLFSI